MPAKSRPMVFLSKYLRCQRGLRRDRACHRRRVRVQVDLISPPTGPGRTAPDICSDIGVSLVAAYSILSPLRPSLRFPPPSPSFAHCVHHSTTLCTRKTPHTCIAPPSSPSPPPTGYDSPKSGPASKRSLGRGSTLPKTRSRCAVRRYRRWTGQRRSGRRRGSSACETSG